MVNKVTQNVKPFFQLPALQYLDENYQAMLLKRIVWLLLILASISVVPFVLRDMSLANIISVVFTNGTMILVCAVALRWIKDKKLKQAGALILTSILLIITLTGLFLGFTFFPYIIYILIITLAASLFGSRGAAIYGVISVAMFAIVIIVNIAFSDFSLEMLSRIFSDMVIGIGTFTIMISLLSVSMNHLEATIARTRQAEKDVSDQIKQRQIAFELSKNILSTFSMEDLIDHTLSAIRETLQSDGTCFYWVDENRQILYAGGTPQGYMDVPGFYEFTIPIGKGVIGDIALTGKAELVNNAYLDPRSIYPENFAPSDAEKDHIIAIPIRFQNRTLAVIVAGRSGKDAKPYTLAEFEQAQFIVNHAGLAVQNIQLFEETQSNEIRFRTLANHLPGSVYQVNNDPSYTLLFASDGIEEIIGYKKELFLTNQMSISDLIHPDDKEINQPSVDDEIYDEGRKPYYYEYRLRHKDGSWHWVEDRGTSIFDANGKFLYLQGFLLDITARKEAEAEVLRLNTNLEALVEKRTKELGNVSRQLQALLDNAPMPIFIKEAPDFKYTLFNKEYQKVRGVTFEQIFHHTDLDFYPKEIAKTLQVMDNEVYESKKTLTVELNLPNHAGEIRTLLSTKFPIFDEGQNLQAIGGVSLDITEYRKEQLELFEVQSQYQSLVERVPSVVYASELGAQGTWLFISPKIQDLLGYSANEWMSTPDLWRERIHPDDRERVIENELEYSKKGETVSIAYRLLSKDEKVVWVQDNAVVAWNNARKKHVWHGTLTDITKQVEADEARQTAERKYREIYESVQDVIYETNYEGVLTSISPSINAYIGRRAEELIGKPVWELFADPNDYEDLNNEILTKGELKNYEIRIKKNDGEILIGSFNAQVVFNTQFQAIGTRGVARDVTELKKIEEDLKFSQERFKLITWATMDAVWDWDLDTNEIWWGDSLQKMFQYSADTQQTDLAWRQSHIHPEDFEKVERQLNKTLSGDMTFWSNEYRFQRLDGSYANVFERAYILRKPDGKAYRIIGAMMDITERKQAEAKLEAQNRQLDTLYNITLSLLNRNQTDHILDDLLNNVRSLLNVDHAIISTLEKDAIVAQAITEGHLAKKGNRIKRGEGSFLAWQAVDSKLPAVIEDYQLWDLKRKDLDPIQIHAVAEIPMIRENKAFGVVSMARTQPNQPFTFDEIELARRFTQIATMVLDNTHLYESAQQELLERKNAEEALRIAEAKFRAIYENVKDVIFETDVNGIITLVSPSIEEQSGYTPDELIGQSTKMFYASSKENRELMKLLLQNGEVNDFQVKLVKKSGQEVYGSATIRAKRDINNAVIGSRGILRDITERMKVEAEIRRQNQYLSALYEITLQLINSRNMQELLQTIVDQTANLINVPYVYIDLLHGKEKLVTKAATENLSFLLGGISVRNQSGFLEWQAIDSGSPSILEDYETYPKRNLLFDQVKLHASVEFPIKVQNQSVGILSLGKDKPNEPFTVEELQSIDLFAQLAGLALDNARLYEQAQIEIEKRKEEQEKTLQLNYELESRVRERTRDLAESNDLLITLADTSLVINRDLKLNNILDQLLYQAHHAVPCNGLSIILVEEDTLKLARFIDALQDIEHSQMSTFSLSFPYFKQMSATGRSVKISDVSTDPNWLPTETTSWVHSYLGVPLIANKKVIGFLNASHIEPNYFTEKQRNYLETLANHASIAIQNAHLFESLDKALRTEKETKAQLLQSQRLALAGRLLATISHELNNPMQAIQNTLFLLKDEPTLSTQGYQDLEILLTETERMSTLLNNLRSVYRPVHAEDFVPVEINQLILDVKFLTAAQLRRQKINLQTELESNLPVMDGHADQLKQAILNLVLNAVEASPTAGLIQIKTQMDGEMIYMSVQDSGRGIDPKILPQIFHEFVTSKSTGTGLGLTMVHDIITHHHGRVTAENHPDGGAIFKIWLPIKQSEAQ